MRLEREGLVFVRFADVLPRVPIRESELDRFKSGKIWFYKVKGVKADKRLLCLDVGCGAKPFPKTDVLCDLCLKPVPDRRMQELVTWGKPFVLCDCQALPFKDKAFDFVSCYYVIEHVDFPGNLLLELKRVSTHGFVQCPSWINEMLYGEDVHKWLVFKRSGRLLLRPIQNERFRLGFVLQRLYQSRTWQVLHAVVDELFQVFTVHYAF